MSRGRLEVTLGRTSLGDAGSHPHWIAIGSLEQLAIGQHIELGMAASLHLLLQAGGKGGILDGLAGVQLDQIEQDLPMDHHKALYSLHLQQVSGEGVDECS